MEETDAGRGGWSLRRRQRLEMEETDAGRGGWSLRRRQRLEMEETDAGRGGWSLRRLDDCGNTHNKILIATPSRRQSKRLHIILHYPLIIIISKLQNWPIQTRGVAFWKLEVVTSPGRYIMQTAAIRKMMAASQSLPLFGTVNTLYDTNLQPWWVSPGKM